MEYHFLPRIRSLDQLFFVPSACRNRQTGERLSDMQVLAQALTFILAGYETTANCITFSIYLISQHPEVQVVRGWRVAAERYHLHNEGSPAQ